MREDIGERKVGEKKREGRRRKNCAKAVFGEGGLRWTAEAPRAVLVGRGVFVRDQHQGTKETFKGD